MEMQGRKNTFSNRTINELASYSGKNRPHPTNRDENSKEASPL
jgi:hypothetical protein